METRAVPLPKAEKKEQLAELRTLLEDLLRDAQALGRSSMRKLIACAIDVGEASARERYLEEYLEFQVSKEAFVRKLSVFSLE